MLSKAKSLYCLIYILMIIIFMLPAAVAQEQNARLNDNPDIRAAIAVFDSWMQQKLIDEQVPGVSIGLIYDQDLLWAKGYGFANLKKRTPATPATAYRIASLTKLYTATAIMQLRDDGKLQLDDPVIKYVPWFHLDDPFADSPVITIRHMLTHTSGLPRELEGLYWDNVQFPDHDKFVQMFQEASAILPRETEYKYSNVAFSILGEIIANVSGEPYPDYVKNHILKPLGMEATEVVPTKDMPELATGYKYRQAGEPRQPEPFLQFNAMTSAAGIATSVEDMARFVSFQFTTGPAGGAQILKGSTLREMQRVQWLDTTWQSGIGFSWFIYKYPDMVQIRHSGLVNGFTSAVSACVDQKFGVIVFANADDAPIWDINNQAWKIIAPIVREVTAVAEKGPVADSSWEKYAGFYDWEDGSRSQVLIIKGELSVVDPRSEDPWGERFRLENVSEGVFRMINGSQKGELIRFDVDPSQKRLRMVWPGYAAVKE